MKSLQHRKILFILFLTVCSRTLCQEEPGYPADEGIYYNHPSIKAWAASCKIIRGYIRIDDKDLGRVTAGDDSNCLGKADGLTVSLGDSGIAVVSFSDPVVNIPGYDFAIYENSFDGSFLELAFVEVSSDSIKWVRFPARSLVPVTQQTGTFGLTNPALIHNLAGKHKAYYGTPFDLQDLKDSAGIDISNIKYIRIIDVTGNIDDRFASYDAYGNRINDPWPTPFLTGGFDLDAVAVLKSPASTEPGNDYKELLVFPNPATERINILIHSEEETSCILTDLKGTPVLRKQLRDRHSTIEVQGIPAGIYFLYLNNNTMNHITRLIIIR